MDALRRYEALRRESREADRSIAMLRTYNALDFELQLARFPPKERAALRAKVKVAVLVGTPRMRLDRTIAQSHELLRKIASARRG